MCDSTSVSAIVIIIALCALTFVLCVGIVFVLQNADCVNDNAVTILILVTFLQTASLLAHVDVPWPAYFRDIMLVVDSFVDFRVWDFSYGECIVRAAGLDYTAKFALQLVLVLEVLISMGAARALLFMFPNALRRNMEINESDRVRARLPITPRRVLCTSALAVLFFTYQSILFYSFGLLSCTSVETKSQTFKRLLQADYSVDCDSSHLTSSLAAAIPTTIVVSVGLPLMFVFAYQLHVVRHPTERNVRYQYCAFLLQGLTKSTWYWQMVVFLRKGVSVAIVAFCDYPRDHQLLTWVLAIYIGLVVYAKPYTNPFHNQIDIVSTLVIVVIANACTVFRTVDSEWWGKDVIAPLSLIAVCSVTLSFLYMTSKQLQQMLTSTIAGNWEKDERDELPAVPPTAVLMESSLIEANSKRRADDDNNDLRDDTPLEDRSGSIPSEGAVPRHRESVVVTTSPMQRKGPEPRRCVANHMERDHEPLVLRSEPPKAPKQDSPLSAKKPHKPMYFYVPTPKIVADSLIEQRSTFYDIDIHSVGVSPPRGPHFEELDLAHPGAGKGHT